MNISAISFGSRQNDDIEIPEWVNRNHPQNRRAAESNVRASYSNHTHQQAYSRPLERTPEKDTFSSKNKVGKGNNKKQCGIGSKIKSFGLGALAALTITQCSQVASQPANVVSIPVEPTTSITEIAKLYDSDVDAILNYNKLSSEADIQNKDSIKVPSKYDYLQEEIDSLQDKLYDKKLTAVERNEIENKLAEYKEKQALQQNVATVYTDGKYVYFTISEAIKDLGFSRINVETFKEIFDIKDKALRRHNDLDYTWGRDPEAPPEDNGYRDYTTESLQIGETVKVKKGDIEIGVHADNND